MGTMSIAQEQQRRKLAVEMITAGLVSPDGKAGQVFIQEKGGLYLANSTACTCPDPACPHTLAADLYNRARYTVETLCERWQCWFPRIAWAIEDDLQTVTDPATVERLTLCQALCEQMHREVLEASRRQPRFQSSYTVSLAGLTRRDGRNWATSRRERRTR